MSSQHVWLWKPWDLKSCSELRNGSKGSCVNSLAPGCSAEAAMRKAPRLKQMKILSLILKLQLQGQGPAGTLSCLWVTYLHSVCLAKLVSSIFTLQLAGTIFTLSLCHASEHQHFLEGRFAHIWCLGPCGCQQGDTPWLLGSLGRGCFHSWVAWDS